MWCVISFERERERKREEGRKGGEREGWLVGEKRVRKKKELKEE